MKHIAIEKARSRLAKAQDCFTRIKRANNFPEFESAWSDFLLATNSIHSILEQGARDNAKSRQWYGRKKCERREDPLLSYIHQARNADEHGLAPVTEHQAGSLTIGIHGEPVHIKKLIINGPNLTGEFVPIGGKFPTVIITPPHAILVTVRDDRFGDTFEPPTEHLGTTLFDTSPLGVAKVALAYYETLLMAATDLVE